MKVSQAILGNPFSLFIDIQSITRYDREGELRDGLLYDIGVLLIFKNTTRTWTKYNKYKIEHHKNPILKTSTHIISHGCHHTTTFRDLLPIFKQTN